MLVVDVEKEAHPCIAISEDNEGVGIEVSVLGIKYNISSVYK